tara:strand:+ start:216 stop:320 length:105 start_codon:yes stop_codon:yes gene_type:complete
MKISNFVTHASSGKMCLKSKRAEKYLGEGKLEVS